MKQCQDCSIIQAPSAASYPSDSDSYLAAFDLNEVFRYCMICRLWQGILVAPALITCEPRDPSNTLLYQVVAEHLETFLASLDANPDAKGLPTYVQ